VYVGVLCESIQDVDQHSQACILPSS